MARKGAVVAVGAAKSRMYKDAAARIKERDNVKRLTSSQSHHLKRAADIKFNPAMFDKGTFNKMVSTDLSSPFYIFSNVSHSQQFYNYTNELGSTTNSESITNSIKKFDNKIKSIGIDKYEIDMATTLCQILGISINGDPRKSFKTWYYDLLNNEDPDLKELQNAFNITSEALFIGSLGELYKVTEEDSNSSKSFFKAQQERLKNNTLNAKETLDFITKNLEVDKLPKLHQFVLNPSKSIKNDAIIKNIPAAVSFQKGFLHEVRLAAALSSLFQSKAIEGFQNSFEAKIEGTINSKEVEEILTSQVVDFASLSTKGTNTSGGRYGEASRNKTDISIEIPSTDHLVKKLNIDVKSSVGGMYTTNKVIDVNLLNTLKTNRNPAIKAAVMSFVNIMVFKGQKTGVVKSTNFLKSPAFFALVMSVIESDYFLENFISLEDIGKGDFQHLIMIEKDLYWYSELLRNYARYFVYEVENGQISSKQVKLNNIQALQASQINSDELTKVKVALLRRNLRKTKTKHSYEGGYNYLMQNANAKVKGHNLTIEEAMNTYYNNLKSVSMRFDLSLKMSHIL